MRPPAYAVLPPLASSGAASSMTTASPLSRAASAAHDAALPAPTTSTSTFSGCCIACPRLFESDVRVLDEACRLGDRRLGHLLEFFSRTCLRLETLRPDLRDDVRHLQH